MTRPLHTLIEISGVFGSSVSPLETWTTTLRASGHVAPGNLVGVTGQVSSLWNTHIKPVVSNKQACSNFRVANIKGQDADDVAGRVVRNADGSMQQYELAFSAIGTLTPEANLPLQTALVVSLDTVRQGATGKGRVFHPWPGYGLEDDFRIPAAKALAVAEAYSDFIVALNANADLGAISIVSSKGYSSAVTSVRVGRTPDTMRSRRTNMPEGYVVSPL